MSKRILSAGLQFIVIVGLVAALAVLLALYPTVAQAGQGGGNSPADSNMTPLIVVGLAALVIVAGIGLLISRRKS